MTGHNCPVCEEQFDAAGTVREHAWTTHGACHHCGDGFDDEEALYAHWLAAHEGELTRANRKRAESAVGSPSFRDRLSSQGVGGALGGISRRSLLVATGTAAAGGAAVAGTVLLGGDGTDEPTGDGTGDGSGEVSGVVPSAPVPLAPDEHQYATTGADDPELTVTYFGSWKCPHCGRFSTGFLPTLVEDYVRPGDVAIRYRNLTYVRGGPFLGSDAPAAGNAGLAAWNADPGSYWAYHEHVFRNQPSEGRQWATADRLATFAQEAGVSSPDAVRAAVSENRYDDALRATSQAAADAGVGGTPTLVVDGTTVSPFERERTRTLIENALG